MQFTPATPASVAAFLAVVAAVVAATVAGVWLAGRRVGASPARRLLVIALLATWLVQTSAVCASGALAARPMPRVPLFLASMLVASLAFGLSPAGRWLAVGLPLSALVAFQAFRLPLELVLHEWAVQGTVPGTMTWTGQNLDIFSGVVALVAAPFASQYRWTAWAANLVGIALLLNVGRVAAMSSPLPFAWGVEPPLQLVFHLPYAVIAPVCVAGAAAGHVVLTRALLTNRHGR